MSSGAIVRGSITSTEIPRSASRSAAASASSTMPDSATTVTSAALARDPRAEPNGIGSALEIDLGAPPVEADVLDEEHRVGVAQRASASARRRRPRSTASRS